MCSLYFYFFIYFILSLFHYYHYFFHFDSRGPIMDWRNLTGLAAKFTCVDRNYNAIQRHLTCNACRNLFSFVITFRLVYYISSVLHSYSKMFSAIPLYSRFYALRKHAYSNILKILPPKNEIFQTKIPIFFHISAQNIDCGYSLEPPRRGGSNEYPLSMFLSRNKKNNVYPCRPQFYYIKVGFKGVKIIIGVFLWWENSLSQQC